MSSALAAVSVSSAGPGPEQSSEWWPVTSSPLSSLAEIWQYQSQEESCVKHVELVFLVWGEEGKMAGLGEDDQSAERQTQEKKEKAFIRNNN